jgi:D-alanine-D-alanine ligase-like ATP-grasp enzyme
MRESKHAIPYLCQLVVEVWEEMWAQVWLEPEFWYVGYITFQNGKRHIFRKSNFNINPLGSIEIAKDKGYSSLFLENFGYSVIKWATFFSDELALFYQVDRWITKGWEYAQSLWLPVIVKPNNLSQGVWVEKIYTEKQYRNAIGGILELTGIFRVERFFEWKDYRLVVLDDEVISAYERTPLAVLWDGIFTIRELLRMKQEIFTREGRDTIIKLDDPRIHNKLSHIGYTIETIPAQGENILLLDNANLSTGWDAYDFTWKVHKDFLDIAVSITRDMWLRLCWVDIMISWDITEPISSMNTYVVIEVNGAPWLDHYLSSWEDQRKIVKNMYRKILLALSQL